MDKLTDDQAIRQILQTEKKEVILYWLISQNIEYLKQLSLFSIKRKSIVNNIKDSRKWCFHFEIKP